MLNSYSLVSYWLGPSNLESPQYLAHDSHSSLVVYATPMTSLIIIDPILTGIWNVVDPWGNFKYRYLRPVYCSDSFS
ncbi:hypothetical protein HAX54_040517, partial [Datura stramonium]|nr:hypothetical protein [Datura stramonium]